MKIAVDEEKQMVHVWNRGKEKQVTGTVFRDDELVSFAVSLSGAKKETSSFRVVSEFAVEELGETKARWTNTKARESAEVADPILPAGELLPSQLRSVLTREQRARVAHLSALPRAAMNATKAVELVVAAYDEDLSWLRMYANISTVYVKGKLVYGDGLGPAPTLVRTLPNVGRETHTYLHHIVENYNELADVTVFTQGMAPMRGYQGHRLGGGHMHCGVTLHDFILSPSTLFVFTEMLSLDKVFHGVRAGYDSRIPCQHNRSSAIFPPTCYNARQIQGTGSLDFIMRRIAKTCSLQTNNTQDCTVLGFWRRFIKLPLPPMLVTWYSQGAVFAVTRDDIRKRPRSEYEQLLALASKSADPFVGYLMEWFWYHLLTSNPIACDPKAWPFDSFVSESDSHFDTRPNDLQLVNLQLAEQEQRAAGWSPQSGSRGGGGSALYTRRNYDEATIARCCGYATLFTSASFLPALQVFLHSFTAQKRDSHPLVICFPLHNWELTALVGRELDKYPGLAVSVMGLSTIASPNPMHKRWRLNWMKLHLWNMTEFARIFYVDLDVLVLRPLDAVFAMPMTSHFFLGSSDVGRWTQPDSDKMNGGVFLLKPDKAVYARILVEMRRNVSAYKSEEAEQGFFNFFFAGQCCLPVAYNSQKMLQRYWPSLWNLSEIRVLHFVGEKPWQHWSSSQYRDHWMAKSLVAERMRDDSWDADHFLELHNMWKQVYFQARRGEFTRLEMFAGYHSESCWKLLDSGPAAGTTARTTSVRLAGPMFRPHVDIDGPAVAPELRDSKFQKLVGAEFATMLAATVATQSNASFLGFASWNAAIKATWVQGASIDWTKVDFAEDLVYFWYGDYSQDYWALQEKSHPGIGTALERVVGHSLPKLPPGFYPCGQYFLASRRIVHAYVDSAKQFVSNFTRHFAHSTICPFALASAADDGCLGHLLESHLNIWIALQGVGLRYVVEDAVAESALERTRRKAVEQRNKQTRSKN